MGSIGEIHVIFYLGRIRKIVARILSLCGYQVIIISGIVGYTSTHHHRNNNILRKTIAF
jgi:hypothetical protein